MFKMFFGSFFITFILSLSVFFCFENFSNKDNIGVANVVVKKNDFNFDLNKNKNSLYKALQNYKNDNQEVIALKNTSESNATLVLPTYQDTIEKYKDPNPASLAFIKGKKGVPSKKDLNYIGRIYGLPENLLFAVMMKESIGNSNSVSYKNAKGAFQFTHETAKEFGLIKNHKDLRANAWYSADAAARYLKWLFVYISPNKNPEKYSSYKYVLAAYNAGIARVKHGNVIYIPNIRETKDYVAKIIGFLEGYKYIVKKGDTLKQIAENKHISIDKLKLLNYGLTDTSLKYGSFINVGVSNYKGDTYIVKSGDTLNKIASLTGVDLYTIKKENKIKGNTIYVGQELYIPKNT